MLLERELVSAIHANKAAVNKLKKYELRRWAIKLPDQREACRLSRQRLYAAWDAVRTAAQAEEDAEEAPYDPFSRDDPRSTRLTQDDVDLILGKK